MTFFIRHRGNSAAALFARVILPDRRAFRAAGNTQALLPSSKAHLAYLLTRFKHDHHEPHQVQAESFPFQVSTFCPDGLIFGRLCLVL
jgi:hypothetical protein